MLYFSADLDLGTLDFRSEPLDLAWSAFSHYLSQVKGKDLRNKSNPPCAISFKEIRHVSFHVFHCLVFPRNNESLQGPPIIPLPTRRRNRGPKGSRAVTAIGPPKNGLDISGHFAYTLYLDTKVFASFAKVYLSFLHDQDYIMYFSIHISYMHSIHAFLWSINSNDAVLSE